MTLDVRIITCDIGHLEQADLATVDVLARLRLVALRRGRRLRLVNPSPDLLALLRWAGLCEVFELDRPLCREVRGQTEEREEAGRVEEEGDAGDPIG